MAVIQYLDKRGLKTLVGEISKRTSSIYVVKGGGFYADETLKAELEKEDGAYSEGYDGLKEAITTAGESYKGLWQRKDDTWAKVTDVKVGWVYNVRNTFTTDADFVEGSGHKVEGGTNIVVAKVSEDGDDIKWDLLAMSLNLDPYQTKKLLASIDVFTAPTSRPIKVTSVESASALSATEEAKQYDVAITADTDEVYRFNGTSWVNIGDQVTVEGSLKLLSNVAPNTPISDAEILEAFAESES